MADDIQKTIEEIDETIEANTLEPPLPKAAPTQHGINQCPTEMPYILDVDAMRETLEALPGLDTSAVVSYTERFSQLRCNQNGYEIRCQACSFRFRSNDIDSFDLAELHSHRNQHRVSFKFGFFGRQYDLTIEPKKPKWRERLNRWAVCMGLPILIVVLIWAILGELSWWRVGSVGIGALIGFNLYQYWQNRKGDKNQE